MRNIKITKFYTATEKDKELTYDHQIRPEETEEMERWMTSQSIYVTFSITLIGIIGIGYTLIKLIQSILN